VALRFSAAIKLPFSISCHSEPTRSRRKPARVSEESASSGNFHHPRRPCEIHSSVVTSNLARHRKLAHHGQGGGSLASKHDIGRKSFVAKILTSKSFVVRILRRFSCYCDDSTRPQGEGGIDPNANRCQPGCLELRARANLLSGRNPQAGFQQREDAIHAISSCGDASGAREHS
jgi:hypothetical protein